jgi:hypothetical protein
MSRFAFGHRSAADARTNKQNKLLSIAIATT